MRKQGHQDPAGASGALPFGRNSGKGLPPFAHVTILTCARQAGLMSLAASAMAPARLAHRPPLLDKVEL